ncbi:MAG: hypothetical protein HKM89_08945 [Gemmatimonadales bacterium]|nr:hypothetical protein [Gemmatimonadales bacterium]
MTVIDFGPDRIRVVPATKDAWTALARVMATHDYRIRTTDTDSYNCRAITGGTGKSLHSYGIALDVNWKTNPFKNTPNRVRPRFSSKRTQEGRGADVRDGAVDTDMTERMIEDVRAITTVDGKTVFVWGGDWRSIKDAMHFQIDLTPAELGEGIEWRTVKGDGGPVAHSLFVREGDVGDTVEYYQRKLARLSPTSPGRIDGEFGPKTAASVSAFQKSRTPKVDEGASGNWIGPWTMSELDAAEAELAAP